MRKEILNGTRIPYDAPMEDLKKLIDSPVMKDFSLACEVLSCMGTSEAYEILKLHINDKDKYRRLYILKTIFRYSEAVELVDHLERAIASDDFLFVENGLGIIADYKIKVSEAVVISAVYKYFSKLYTAIRALEVLGINENNYIKLTELFKKAEQCSQKELIGNILAEKYLPSKSRELFDLFRSDGFAKIRIMAVKLGKKYGYDLSSFLSDIDGHVRKSCEREGERDMDINSRANDFLRYDKIKTEKQKSRGNSNG